MLEYIYSEDYRMENSMKKLFLFSTKLYNFWTGIPFAALLLLSIYFNGSATGLMKLYPLMILSAAGIVFVIIFFLRGIVLTYDDARCIGLFSKKDHASFKKDYSLVITELRRGRLLVEVYGYVEEGGIGYDWYDVTDVAEINLLRARTNGGRRTIKRILLYYGFDPEDVENALTANEYSADARDAALTSTVLEGSLRVRITFKELYKDDVTPKADTDASKIQ